MITAGFRMNSYEKKEDGRNYYPYSRLRLFSVAVAAFPPPYFLVNSSFTLSRKAIGICLPADSTATTQYATRRQRYENLVTEDVIWTTCRMNIANERINSNRAKARKRSINKDRKGVCQEIQWIYDSKSIMVHFLKKEMYREIDII